VFVSATTALTVGADDTFKYIQANTVFLNRKIVGLQFVNKTGITF
jgi:hypothetical protein